MIQFSLCPLVVCVKQRASSCCCRCSLCFLARHVHLALPRGSVSSFCPTLSLIRFHRKEEPKEGLTSRELNRSWKVFTERAEGQEKDIVFQNNKKTCRTSLVEDTKSQSGSWMQQEKRPDREGGMSCSLMTTGSHSRVTGSSKDHRERQMRQLKAKESLGMKITAWVSLQRSFEEKE